MINDELKKFNEFLLLYTKHYNGIILNQQEIDTIIDTPDEYRERINEIIRQEDLRTKKNGSFEKYLMNKINVQSIIVRNKIDFDYNKNSDNALYSFDQLIIVFRKYYFGMDLSNNELEIIANTSPFKIEKIEEIIRQEKLRQKEDGSYLRYIRNCACFWEKKNSFYDFNTVYVNK